MFNHNAKFRVTIRDFQDRCEPQVLKEAGKVFVRTVRETSADYLENCLDPDAELQWTVTIHNEIGVGTIHYVVFREGQGFEGKCLVWDLTKEPVADRPWTPIIMRAGELQRAYPFDFTIEQPLAGVVQPNEQTFSHYYFRSWIPVARISADMVEENTEQTLIGAGFTPDLVLGTPDHPIGMADTLRELRDVHNSVVKNHNLKMQDDAKEPAEVKLQQAGREYEFDQRAAKESITLKINYLKINPVDREADVPLTETSFEAVFQEGGWLDGAFAKSAVNPQFVSLATWINTVDFDAL